MIPTASQRPAALRIGFVTGVVPDKWARSWRERRPRDPLQLVPLDPALAETALRSGEVDMVLVRGPVDRDGLHRIPLYQELPVVVVARDHVVSAYDEIALADLADEQFALGPPAGFVPDVPQLAFPPMTPGEAVEVAASGTAVVVLPMSVARLHHRKDVVAVRVLGLPETEIALAWLVARDDEHTQEFVGVVRGRTARSSR
jgi:DNA-binding transcriptional LysR family regulator